MFSGSRRRGNWWLNKNNYKEQWEKRNITPMEDEPMRLITPQHKSRQKLYNNTIRSSWIHTSNKLTKKWSGTTLMRLHTTRPIDLTWLPSTSCYTFSRYGSSQTNHDDVKYVLYCDLVYGIILCFYPSVPRERGLNGLWKPCNSLTIQAIKKGLGRQICCFSSPGIEVLLWLRTVEQFCVLLSCITDLT